jgi:hypothetical protein
MANSKLYSSFWDREKDVLRVIGSFLVVSLSATVAVGLALLIPPLGLGLVGGCLIVLGLGLTIGIGLLWIACCFRSGNKTEKSANIPVEQPKGAGSWNIGTHLNFTQSPTSAYRRNVSKGLQPGPYDSDHARNHSLPHPPALPLS